MATLGPNAIAGVTTGFEPTAYYGSATSGFRAHHSGAQTIATAGGTVAWATEDWDLGAEFATNTFTNIRAGTYLFVAQVELANAALPTGKYLTLSLKADSTVIATKTFVQDAVTANAVTITLTAVVNLTAGQAVTVYGVAETADRTTTGTAATCFFTGVRLI